MSGVTYQVLHVMCQVSCVTCQVSCVSCHISGVIVIFIFISDKAVGLVGGGSVINGAYPV